MKNELSADFGASILARQAAIEADLAAVGPDGLMSIVKALVWSGTRKREEICARVERVADSYLREWLDDVLELGNRHHWVEHEGMYHPMVADSEHFELLSGAGA